MAPSSFLPPFTRISRTIDLLSRDSFNLKQRQLSPLQSRRLFFGFQSEHTDSYRAFTIAVSIIHNSAHFVLRSRRRKQSSKCSRNATWNHAIELGCSSPTTTLCWRKPASICSSPSLTLSELRITVEHFCNLRPN